jgi:hypothetical protein
MKYQLPDDVGRVDCIEISSWIRISLISFRAGSKKNGVTRRSDSKLKELIDEKIMLISGVSETKKNDSAVGIIIFGVVHVMVMTY